MADVIRAEGLVKRYSSRSGEVRALDGLDLAVPEATVLGLLGPNGAGKTTAVRILATLLQRREQAAGEASDAAALAAAGWPGERILAAAAANRVRVALSSLRKAGLGAALVRGDGGWWLDPAVPVVVVA